MTIDSIRFSNSAFQNSVLSDIANLLVMLDNMYIVVKRKFKLKILLSPRHRMYLLNNDDLVENTLKYGADVHVDALTISSNLQSVHTVNVGDDKLNRTYKRQPDTTNQSKDIVTGIVKPKRFYVCKNSDAKENHGIHIDNENLVTVDVVTEMEPFPRKNISRRSIRTSVTMDLDVDVIEHSTSPSEYGDLGDASYECIYCHA
ncbi:hypothetical protein CASFOL_018639 [Castilleja foliolosa]|uniref:Uncharacterized protein n=1 Tax=Castilleja foliolosa TaxID=1961234 RepID=A0ABD3D7C0_9LAMI